MNNQFFGDERDFYKYALLRILSDGGKCQIAVCWLLTTCGRNGGGELAYLRNGDYYRQKDEKLFNFLHEHICDKKIRDVTVMNNKIIPRAKFFVDEFSLDEEGRKKYWDKFIKEYNKNKLLFFDADTGINPKYPGNRKDEYIREYEIKNLWTECDISSLMIFQYFRLAFGCDQTQKRHKDIMASLMNIDKQAKVLCLYKRPVAYYFIIRKGHNEICDRINFAKKELGFEEYD